MAEWDNELILSFLEMYKNEPILWDPNHVHNKDKKRTNDAWVRISECIDIPVSELKKKKESLMATFRSHLRRKNAGIKSGVSEDDLHRPVWYAYEFMEEFLAPVYNQKKTVNSQSKVSDEQKA